MRGRGGMRPLILLTLITPSARACFDETRGGCFTAGFVDNLSSAEDCQAACAFDSACNYFAYHAARGDRRRILSLNTRLGRADAERLLFPALAAEGKRHALLAELRETDRMED